MENATKALLMAGAVLIAIILIAVAVRTINSTKGTTESVQTTMSATEVATFNNKFAGYTGNSVPLAKVKALANLVIANNANSSHKVKFNGADTPAAIQTQVDALTGSTFKVTPVRNEETGLLEKLTIGH